MLRLKWEEVKNENVIFYRKKTETTQRINKKPVNVPLNDGAQALLEKIGNKDSIFVLGLLEEGYSEKTITNKSNKNRKDLNLHLKSIEKKLKLSAPLRLKTARDCYASCLNRAGVPTKFISELMVHSSVHVTENYLSGMNNKEIFDANSYLY